MNVTKESIPQKINSPSMEVIIPILNSQDFSLRLAQFENSCWVQAAGSKGDSASPVQRAESRDQQARVTCSIAPLTRPGWSSILLLSLSSVWMRRWEVFDFLCLDVWAQNLPRSLRYAGEVILSTSWSHNRVICHIFWDWRDCRNTKGFRLLWVNRQGDAAKQKPMQSPI